MTRSRDERARREDMAAAHFAALDIALSRGDYAAAALAQKALAELGWSVHLKPRQTPPTSPQEATGREGGHDA